MSKYCILPVLLLSWLLLFLSGCGGKNNTSSISSASHSVIHANFVSNKIMSARMSAGSFIDQEEETSDSSGTRVAAKKVLLLYDASGEYSWIGKIYSRHLMNMLSHFEIITTRKPVEKYQLNDYQNYDAVIYLGCYYNEQIPDSIITDLMATSKPFMWIGSNLSFAAIDSATYEPIPDFENKFGIRYFDVDFTGYSIVNFNGYKLNKLLDKQEVNIVKVTDNKIAQVLATAENTAGTKIPYAVKCNNFWYICENPLASAEMSDRGNVIAEILHDFLGIPHQRKLTATLRIEDVYANTPPEKIIAISDLLYAEKVPFAICIIPEYTDPLGAYNSGVPITVTLNERPEFVAAINYAISKGGYIVQHGYTHQYSNIKNPINGVSGDDYEFYRITMGSDGSHQYVGALPEDSVAWAMGRVKKGNQAIINQNWNPIAWNTPHYVATPNAYKAFINYYKISMDRGMAYITGPDNTLYFAQQALPYVIHKDQFGFTRVPENLGYINPSLNDVTSLPADIIARAEKDKVIRDPWVGFYFHWFLDINYLKQTVTGLKSSGYIFVKADEALKY